jgi:Flp pilus assembly protein TadB
VRKFGPQSRRAQIGSNGYAVLFRSPVDQSRATARPRPLPRPTAVSIGKPLLRSQSRPDIAVRQRQVLIVLSAALAVPVLIALVTGSVVTWWVVVALLPVVCAYLAGLFRARRVMAEREINSAFFGGTPAVARLEDVFSARPNPGREELRAVSAGSRR